MAELMRVPEVAAGATDVVLSEWLAQEGAAFAVGDSIAVIETDKAQVEIEAETSGVLLRTLVVGGSEVAVGAAMALIGVNEDLGTDLDALLEGLGVNTIAASQAPVRRDVPEPDVTAEAVQATPPVAMQTSAIDQSSQAATSTVPAPLPRPSEAAQGIAGWVTEDSAAAPHAKDRSRRFASPLARKMLYAAGIDIADFIGTGPRGRISRRDAEAALESSRRPSVAETAPTPVAPPAPMRSSADQQSFTEIPHTRLRRAVAKRLTASKQEVPHFYLKRTVEVDALLKFRTELNSNGGSKVSVNDLVIKAVGVAHVAVPSANVIWTDDALHQFDTVDISVAIASDRGLVTPVLRGVEQRSLGTVSADVRRHAQAANAGSLRQADLEGGSISITNLGMLDVDEFSAIINPPQSMILAVGAIRSAAVVRDGAVVPASTMTLVLSVDHRAIDGALAAEWFKALARVLGKPYLLAL